MVHFAPCQADCELQQYMKSKQVEGSRNPALGVQF